MTLRQPITDSRFVAVFEYFNMVKKGISSASIRVTHCGGGVFNRFILPVSCAQCLFDIFGLSLRGSSQNRPRSNVTTYFDAYELQPDVWLFFVSIFYIDYINVILK